MLIVLEGCDGAGKTSAAHLLMDVAKRHGIESRYWHRGVPVRHPLAEYETDLEIGYDRGTTNELLVCDRWHLGQLVYGGLYRDNNLLGAHGAWHVDAFLQSRGALQVIIDQPDEVLISRVLAEEAEGKGDDALTSADAGYLQAEHVAYVASAYRGLSLRCSRTVTTHHGDVTPTAASMMIARASAHERDARWLRNFSSYVGPHNPDIILVGDKRGNPDPNREPHSAAFVPYAATSGAWLTRAIVESGLQLYRLGIVNANEDDVSHLFYGLRERPLVVALGEEAHATLEATGVAHGQVPHPQYARRFQYTSYVPYAWAILEAAHTQKKVTPEWL